MSDFLSNLATRTLGLESSVQPRLPSLFAPPNSGAFQQLSPVTGPWSEKLEMDEVGEGTGDFARPTRTGLSATFPRMRAKDSQPAFLRVAGNEATLQGESPAISPMVAFKAPPIEVKASPVTPSQGAFVPDSVTLASSANELNHPPTRGVDFPFASEAAVASVFPATSKPPTEQRMGERRGESALPEDAATRDVSRTRRSESVTASDAGGPPPVGETHLQVASPVRPTIKPVNPAAFVVEDKRAEPATQPTIHVTIGRIEVRANTTPRPHSSSQGTKESTRAMGLEDYLRQRGGSQGGGGRR